MIQINLLPWRQQAREIKKKRCITLAVIFSAVTLLIILIFHLYISHNVSREQELADYLQTEINQQQVMLNNMSNEESERNKIVTQLRFIKNMLNKNLYTVQLFNELAKLVPDNISVSKIIRTGNSIVLAGMANNDEDITLFMQAIGKSTYLKQPALTLINQGDSSNGERYFELTVEERDNHLS